MKNHFQLQEGQQPILSENKEAIEEITCKSISNESQLFSFSLTSIIEDSVKLEQLHRRRKEHTKVVSDLSHTGGLKNQFSSGSIKPKKEVVPNFKKHKREGKMEVITESKETKASSMINPLSQLLNVKSPTSTDKKTIKTVFNHSSAGKRKKLD